MTGTTLGASGPLRDGAGVPKFRHEAIGVVLRVVGGELCVLVLPRTRAPFAGQLALPSGPLEVEESLDDAVGRHLLAKAGLAQIAYQEQLQTRGAPGRDPFDRTIATAYLAILPWDAVGEADATAKEARWLPVRQAREMAFDHAELVADGVGRLRAKLSYTNIGFALAPEVFSIKQLALAYAAVLGYDVSATNLQRILQRRGQLVDTGQQAASASGGGGRPARLYRFAHRCLQVTDPFAVLRP